MLLLEGIIAASGRKEKRQRWLPRERCARPTCRLKPGGWCQLAAEHRPGGTMHLNTVRVPRMPTSVKCISRIYHECFILVAMWSSHCKAQMDRAYIHCRSSFYEGPFRKWIRLSTHSLMKRSHTFILRKAHMYICEMLASTRESITFTHTYMKRSSHIKMSKKLWECKSENIFTITGSQFSSLATETICFMCSCKAEALLDIKLYWGTGPYSYPFFFFQACCAQCTTRL